MRFYRHPTGNDLMAEENGQIEVLVSVPTTWRILKNKLFAEFYSKETARKMNEAVSLDEAADLLETFERVINSAISADKCLAVGDFTPLGLIESA